MQNAADYGLPSPEEFTDTYTRTGTRLLTAFPSWSENTILFVKTGYVIL
jgi:hypothetical protein